MRPPLPAKQCYALLEKHGTPTTGYITVEKLFALIREASAKGADCDVVHIKYRPARVDK